MTVTLLGDFADPLSFLASQRVAQIASLGLLDIRWLAVEGDRTHPIGGRPLDAVTARLAGQLSLPGEQLPEAGRIVSNSRAATAAYAEAVADGTADVMRRALFDALWLHGRRVDDPDVVRSVAFDAISHDRIGDIDTRIRANRPLAPLGDVDTFAISRRQGFLVSAGRGPVTTAGQRRLDAWRRLWRQCGALPLPLLLTDLGEAHPCERALEWLASRLPHRSIQTSVPTATSPSEPVGAR